ncbi:uncharacterized protein PRCAT00002733001 [Priceomyces carsonii]|uniref:uncharacterized protein n=1 Tax=Priceomyces carsonii TaxID=28549 RepID=UPI002ED8E2D0|nr:unnamed protein product [Priceomyces carsonii]
MARQNFIGLVVSQGKMTKTVKVRVQTKAYDNRVHKEIIKRKDYLVHDEGNLCKEGDIVRIEAIPKISARKYFAIAEIKVNKGQQFALYETLAKEKVSNEEQKKVEEFIEKRNDFEKVINKVEDLRKLDQITRSLLADPSADRQFLLNEINSIKEKYGIKSWPSTEPVLKLEINESAKDLSNLENRIANIKPILERLMSDEFTSFREDVLSKMSKTPVQELKPHTQKNILRKFVLNPKNECPVAL